jgi:hypothetical protein
MAVSKFDIFEGVFPDKDLMWIACMANQDAACEFMNRLAKRNPGRSYFTIDISTRELLASVAATEPR